ncbi:MAG: hypothetical protein HW378_3266 [Anaerolineales bacterium]|jgi:hypothetical protein|nr:hypothetical protein [Anaerolineales bacterium]MBM2847578.1 hypothetical protein [Anaerolineales bacterium]
MSIEGRPLIFANGLILNRPAPHDPTIYPSDHFGLAARLKLCT